MNNLILYRKFSENCLESLPQKRTADTAASKKEGMNVTKGVVPVKVVIHYSFSLRKHHQSMNSYIFPDLIWSKIAYLYVEK